MSFDLYFVPRPSDDRWDHVMDEIERVAAEERELTDADLALWARIAEAVTNVAPDVEQFSGDRHRQLDDGVGMQLTMYPGEITINTPYWFEGEAAGQVVEKLRRVVGAVEAATGLVAYDPQADAAFLDEGSASAVGTFDQVADRMGEQLGTRGATQRQKRRWSFWRR